MQLLVSVRSAAEVEPALAGGADIIDAKEPARGPLGPVTAPTLAGILAQVPGGRPFSVALGDVGTVEELDSALAALELPTRSGPTFIKVGFARVESSERVGALLAAAVTRASAWPSPPGVVAVAYGDSERAGSLSPQTLSQLAHGAGAAGVLMDTYVKDGAGLLRWRTPNVLAAWIAKSRGMGLLTGLAGALCPDDVQVLLPGGPDVLGFRGAACEAGRMGEVSAPRVALLRSRIDWGLRGSVGTSAHHVEGHRETRDPVA